MSRENVERYRRAIAAWNDGDLGAFLEDASPDWKFRTTGTFPGFKPLYEGHEGATEFWNTLRDPWEHFLIELERTVDAGDRVVGLLTFRGRGKTSGVETTLEYAHVATYVDGKNTRLEGYLTHREALEAVGLRE
jgi:ketosteroid isomerase-like protein